MSRPSNLPPRCPLQRKSVRQAPSEPWSCKNTRRVNEFGIRRQKSLSQGSMFEDHPAWFNDLLSDGDSISKGMVHQRSASDSGTLFDDLVPNMGFSLGSPKEQLDCEEGGNSLEAGCVYGPNSPRRKSNVDCSDTSALLALSDYVNQSWNSEQFVEDGCWSSRHAHFDMNGDCYGSLNDIDGERKTEKSCKHPGQRSRARKLQYIGELERTVNFFQALESELTIQVSNLLQERVVLSKENSTLKQQMAKLQRKKLLMDGEYQILRKEADRLKLSVANSLNSSKICKSGATESNATGVSWQTLQWAKLRL
ncbi:hypothetical protein vseg_010609 [Gypsophila vaccaria]